MEISATVKTGEKAGSTVKVNYDFPADLAALTAKFGESVVFSNAKSAIIIGLQALLRRHIDKPQDELQKIVNAYVPSTRESGPRKTQFEKVQDALGSLSEEEKKELIRKLRAA